MSLPINLASAYTKLVYIAALISKGECTSIKHMKSLIEHLRTLNTTSIPN